MFAFTILAALLAPIFWRVFWKSFDEIDALENRILGAMPEIVGAIYACVCLAGIIAFITYKFVGLTIEQAAFAGTLAGGLFLRLPLNTLDSRLMNRLIRSAYVSLVNLKAKSIR